MTKIPVLTNINTFRETLFDISHGGGTPPAPMAIRTASWTLHKAVSVICLPANGVASAVGLTCMAATCCTLGALKVSIYAATLGNVEPTFSIGFVWLGERTILSMYQVCKNLGELAYDAGDLCYQGYENLRYVLTALKMGHVMKYVKKALEFIGERISKGVNVAINDEQSLAVPNLQATQRALQEATARRSCLNANQNWTMFFEHKMLSVINIPLQGSVAAFSAAACGCALVASIAKASLYALTNIHVSVPTGVSYFGRIALLSGLNTAQNCAELVADGVVSIYKIADSLHIMKALATVGDVLAFIPRAICT